MSKLFNDPTYRRMQETEEGWLELAIEPFYFELNNKIAKMPERMEFDFDLILPMLPTQIQNWGNSLSIGQFISLAANINDVSFNYTESNLIQRFFSLYFEPDTVVDVEEGKMSSPIVLIKKQDGFPEEEIPAIIAEMAMSLIRVDDNNKRRSKSEIISRMNEISELIGATESRSSKSIRTKLDDIKRTMKKIISEDKWKIRNEQIAYDAADWISSYCNYGRLDSLMNFTRLKCMTHAGNPIYSMEEIK